MVQRITYLSMSLFIDKFERKIFLIVDVMRFGNNFPIVELWKAEILPGFKIKPVVDKRGNYAVVSCHRRG